MEMKVTNLTRLGEWDAERIRFALKGANRILSSPALDAFFLNAKLTETKIDGEGPSLTNEEVLARIKNADQLNPLDEKGVLDVQVVLYRKSWSKVVGYTQTNSLTIYVNRRFFGDPSSIASNLFHEAMHQLGFLHDGTWATSVPYQANKFIEAEWKKQCADIDAEYKLWWNS